MDRRHFHLRLAGLLALGAPLAGCAQRPAAAPIVPPRADLARTIDAVMQPLRRTHDLPGLSVGVIAGGQRHLFHYGVASRASGAPVTDATLFEVGSVSKTFTAALAAYAQAIGALSLGDPASRHWPALRGSRFDAISLLELGTYTAGGLPLQMPDGVKDMQQALAYYRAWQPAHAPGTHRLYSNASLGLFGHLAARSLDGSFEALMQQHVLSPLGLGSTYLRVPAHRQGDYAWGERDGKPVRVSPGMWDAEAYGVKTTADDLLRFVQAHLAPARATPALAQALATVQAGYFEVGTLTQALGWEMYAPPWSLEALLAGNGPDMILKPNPATSLVPARARRPDSWVNKTGSTNGFGAYVAFIPAQGLALVMLANKNYPNAARVQAAHEVLTSLAASMAEPR